MDALRVPVNQGFEERDDQSALGVVDHLHLVAERNPIRLGHLADGLVEQRVIPRVVEVRLVFGPRPRNRRQARLQQVTVRVPAVLGERPGRIVGAVERGARDVVQVYLYALPPTLVARTPSPAGSSSGRDPEVTSVTVSPS